MVRAPGPDRRRIVGVVFAWLANWWDAVALWLSELAFPFQFALVIAVLAPLCLVVAWAIDRAVDLVSARFTRSGEGSTVRVVTVPTPGAKAELPNSTQDVRADVPAGTPATIITSVLQDELHEELREDRPAVHS